MQLRVKDLAQGSSSDDLAGLGFDSANLFLKKHKVTPWMGHQSLTGQTHIV